MTTLHSLEVRIHAPGEPDALRIDEVRVPAPGPGQIRLRHTAIGVNFADVYHRRGLYALPSLPATLGVEGAGVIESVGPGVSGLAAGQRVAYAGLPAGAYAQVRLLAADRAVVLPDAVSDETAAGAMLKGITAHMLFGTVWPLRAGHGVLVHAAAGGLGLVLVQWARALGASVIGTVGSEAKAALARSRGLACAVRYREQDFVAEARAWREGGVDLAVDGIGGETLLRSLDAVRPFGMVASMGQLRGSTRPFELTELGPARSIALARPSVFRFIGDPQRYREGAAATLARLAAGLVIDIGLRLPLAQAAQAHRLLEGGGTSGSVLLMP